MAHHLLGAAQSNRESKVGFGLARSSLVGRATWRPEASSGAGVALDVLPTKSRGAVKCPGRLIISKAIRLL